MDEVTILHGLKDLAMEVTDLHDRINAIEKKLEKCKTLKHICACDECDYEDEDMEIT
jgi:uncharacterized protein with PhoU and TrkA domain